MRNFLHKIMVDITRCPRQRVEVGIDFQWSNLWLYNAFRVFELAFGRRYGIRIESRVATIPKKDGGYISVYEFVTLESLITHGELIIRNLFKKRLKLGFKFVPIPQYAFVGAPSMSPIFSFAIAYVTVDHNFGNPVTSVTITHSPAGSNIADILYVIGAVNLDSITGVTDNGVSMGAALQKSLIGGSATSRFQYMFATLPTTSGNIVISGSPTGLIAGIVLSYSGVVGGFGNNTQAVGGSATTFSTTIATATANETVVSMGESDNQVVSGTWGQNTRYGDGVILNGNYGDLSFVSAGTQTVSYSQSPGAIWIIQAICLKPLAASVVNSGFFFAAAR